MATEAFVETGRDRRELVSDAGFGQLSAATAMDAVMPDSTAKVP